MQSSNARVNRPPSDANPSAGYRLVDLTHTLDERTLPLPADLPFRHTQVTRGEQPAGCWYCSYDLSLCEHCGTHLDAPIHFSKGKPSTSDLELADLSGPLGIIDIGVRCETDSDYLAALADVEVYEATHGMIGPGMFVFFRNG